MNSTSGMNGATKGTGTTGTNATGTNPAGTSAISR